MASMVVAINVVLHQAGSVPGVTPSVRWITNVPGALTGVSVTACTRDFECAIVFLADVDANYFSLLLMFCLFFSC